jgi:hypothetical protein
LGLLQNVLQAFGGIQHKEMNLALYLHGYKPQAATKGMLQVYDMFHN